MNISTPNLQSNRTKETRTKAIIQWDSYQRRDTRDSQARSQSSQSQMKWSWAKEDMALEIVSKDRKLTEMTWISSRLWTINSLSWVYQRKVIEVPKAQSKLYRLLKETKRMALSAQRAYIQKQSTIPVTGFVMASARDPSIKIVKTNSSTVANKDLLNLLTTQIMLEHLR